MIPVTVAFIENDHVRDVLVEKDGKELHQPVSSCNGPDPKHRENLVGQ